MIDGAALAWEQLLPALGEAAGGEIVGEIALEAALAKRLRETGIRLTPEMIDQERRLFEEAAGAGGVGGETASALLERVRRERGLGPTRFAALLRRNAMLRALVRGRVVINEASIRQAYDLTHGERLRARVIVVPTAQEAGEAARRLSAGEEFSKVAAEMSTDASAPRGGVIDPVNPFDPAYPSAVRDTLARMTPGQVSEPVVVESGFALLRLDGRDRPGTAPNFEEARAEMEAVSRRRQERLLMEQLARELSSSAVVRPLDPALIWSLEPR